MLKVIQVADYIQYYCSMVGYYIKPYELQQLLFVAFINYYHKTRKPLFEDRPIVSYTGPRYKSVCEKFMGFGGIVPITAAFVHKVELPFEIKQFLWDFVDSNYDKDLKPLIYKAYKWQEIEDTYNRFDEVPVIEFLSL